MLIALNAFFASAEIALISVNEAKLEKNAQAGDKKALLLQKLKREPERFLASIQILITLSGFLGSAFAADNFARRLSPLLAFIPINERAVHTFCLVVITVILSYITLILGELVPKQLALRHADKIARFTAPVVYAFSVSARPLVTALTESAAFVLRIFGVSKESLHTTITEADVRLYIDSGRNSGAIEKAEHEIINNVFAFNDRSAGDLMTHRKDVVLLRLEESEADWDAVIKKTAHSFFPVCKYNEDEIVCVLSARAYLALDGDGKNRETALLSACESPKFVPSSVKADVLFRNMKKARRFFSVVLDDHGGMAGIVTMTDLLEAIVGDIDSETRLFEELSSGVYRIDGALDIEKAEEALNMRLPKGGYSTFGGFVFSVLGRIPEDGEQVTVETDALIIEVTRVRNHRLEECVVRRTKNRHPADF